METSASANELSCRGFRASSPVAVSAELSASFETGLVSGRSIVVSTFSCAPSSFAVLEIDMLKGNFESFVLS